MRPMRSQSWLAQHAELSAQPPFINSFVHPHGVWCPGELKRARLFKDLMDATSDSVSIGDYEQGT